ncbi:MAG TPA: hypothetical protein VIL30_07755 [Ramlibacter sp.]
MQVHGYERAPVGEFYDDNWVRVSVHLNVGAFAGSFEAAFLTSDFAEFQNGVSSLYESLAGVARFSTLEEQLGLELTGDGRGHVVLKGVALDAPGVGNRLEFEIPLDQGHLSTALKGLHGITSSFPVRAG